MTNDTFVFDTYAILEIISGNENYKTHLNSKIVINNFISDIKFLTGDKEFQNLENVEFVK